MAAVAAASTERRKTCERRLRRRDTVWDLGSSSNSGSDNDHDNGDDRKRTQQGAGRREREDEREKEREIGARTPGATGELALETTGSKTGARPETVYKWLKE